MNLSQMKAVSLAATPGPWGIGGWFDNDGAPELIIEKMTPAGNLVVAVALSGLVGQEANAAHIATFHPARTTLMCEALEAAENIVKHLDFRVVADLRDKLKALEEI